MREFGLKIRMQGKSAEIISILRRFDPSLPLGEIRKRIRETDFVVRYDLLDWDITEEMEGIDRISRFESLIRSLEESGAQVEIYEDEERIDRTVFRNRMQMIREIEREVEEDMDREAEDQAGS